MEWMRVGLHGIGKYIRREQFTGKKLTQEGVRLMKTAPVAAAIISSSKFDDIIRGRMPVRTTIGPLQKQKRHCDRPANHFHVLSPAIRSTPREIAVEDPLKSKSLVGQNRTCTSHLRIIEKETRTGLQKFSGEILFGRTWRIRFGNGAFIRITQIRKDGFSRCEGAWCAFVCFVEWERNEKEFNWEKRTLHKVLLSG